MKRLLLAALLTGAACAQPSFDESTLSGLGIRNIGSAVMSGRISALACNQEKDGKVTVFVGAASGGVWKSSDGCTTFKPVFDQQPVQSIGAIALDPHDSRRVWVGTGESWMRNSVSVGNGVYRSEDGGESWSYLGLPESEHISKIVLHPNNPNIAYVCVPGKLWSDSAQRGLYKTSDGGRSWQLILKGKNLSTGCASLTMNPKDPNDLIAATWDFRRQGWTFRSGGATPEAASASALYRSRDGGKSWTEMTAGLPPKPWGRVEVEFAPSDPSHIYAFVESTQSALLASEDGGRSWEARDKSHMMVWRPFYFANLIVDPSNAERVFKTDLQLIVSEDGGKSFSSSMGGSHCDWHDLWINPKNPKHLIGGDDGGLWISYDGGTHCWKGDNLPISQFYHVSTDDQDPYQVYGGLQDNSSWVGDSAYPGGISNQRWENLFGGDGFWAFADPSDPNYAYAEYQGGGLARIQRKTLSTRMIQPLAGYKEKLRYNWNAPVHLSPNEKGTIYLGSQFLFRSRDQGHNWQRISPDLTSNDPQRQKQEESGGVTVDNSAAEMHCTIYSISESPKNGQVIWTGSDDGRIQLTKDGGTSWTDVTGELGGGWISWVEAGRHAEGTAYVTIDRHTFGDLDSYLYKTSDFGAHWQRISGMKGYLHVVREDPVKPGLLYVGSEFGLWISPDDGRRWAEFRRTEFPHVAVRDIAIQGRDHDLVLATHGRGLWIIDDLTPLRNLDVVGDRSAAFLPGRPVQQRLQGNGGWVDGDAKFTGQNPASGAIINYFQKTRHLFGALKMEVLDEEGKVIEVIPAGKRKGINRVDWSMRVKPPRVPRAATLAGGSSRGPRVVPGSYRVRLTKGGQVLETTLEIQLDRRAPFTVAQRQQNFLAVQQVMALFGDMTDLLSRINGVKEKLPANLQGPFAPRLEDLRKLIVATKEGGAITGEERLREHTDILYSALLDYEGEPSPYLLDRLAALRHEFTDVQTDFQRLLTELKAGGMAPADLSATVSAEDAEEAFRDFLGLPREPQAAANERD